MRLNVLKFYSLIVLIVASSPCDFLFSQVTGEFGFVLIKSNPDNAEVYIDGQATGRTTPWQSSMDVGSYNFTLKHRDLNYHDYEGSFEIIKDQTIIIEARLKPNFGNVFIDSNPQSAKIRINGNAMGETPQTIRNLKSGEHVLELDKESYITLKQIIEVKDEETLNYLLDLDASFGTIGIIATPREAEIYLNDSFMGRGLYSGRLSKGNHKVEIRLNGYRTRQETISMGQGEEKRLQYEINPMLGSISVMVDPPETGVYLNDEFKGLSPLIIPNLTIGDYIIELRQQGYPSFTKLVSVKENQVVNINEKLVKGFHILVTSIPPGADIYIDGNKIGLTPERFLLPLGVSSVALRKMFYLDQVIATNPAEDNQEYTVSLERGISEFKLNTNVDGAVVNLKPVDHPVARSIEFPLPVETRLLADYYDLAISKKDFITINEKLEFGIGSFEKSYTLYPVKYRTKGEALALSLIWPGAGQAWIMRGGAEPIFGVLAWGAVAGGIIKYVEASGLYDEYLRAQIPKDRADLKAQYQKSTDRAELFFKSAGVIWGVNMLWTLIVPSEKRKYRQLELAGFIDPRYNHIQVNLLFNH